MVPASDSVKVTAMCFMAMMMMMMMMTMMMEAAAMPKTSHRLKHSVRAHRRSDGAAVETVPLQLDPNYLVPMTNFKALANISISPWMYNNSSDDSLYPPSVSEARCLLQGCLDSEGLEDQNLESKPIMHQVLRLRRVRSEGAGYHFRLEYHLTAVGCTCVRPIVQHQQ